jgi:hypothetical protein
MNEKEKEKQRIALRELVGHKHFYSRKGKVCYHGDGYKHFMVKAAIGYILRKKGHGFATELEFPNGRIADVVDLETFLIYEAESDKTRLQESRKLGNFWDYGPVADVIVLDPQELPDSLGELKTVLEEGEIV